MAENINIKLILDTANSAKTLKETRAALEQIKAAEKQIGKGTEGFKQLNTAAESLNATLEMVAISFDDVYQGISPLTTQLGELEDRMYQMAAAGEANTEEFKLLQEEAIRLRKVIIDVDSTVDAFAQKGARLKGFIGIAQGIAGGFGIAQGAAALFGGESKNLEKSLVKLNSILAILNGVQAISQVITEKNVVLDGISNGIRSVTIKLVGQQAVATAAQAATTGTATIAQRALNAAMAANPIGILITLIVAGVAALSLWSSSSDDAAAAQEKLNKEIELNTKIREINAQTQTNINNTILTAQEEIIQNEIMNNQQSLALLELKTKKTAADNAEILRLKKELVDGEQILDDRKLENTLYNSLAQSQAVQAELDGKKLVLDQTRKQLDEISKLNADGSRTTTAFTEKGKLAELMALEEQTKLEWAETKNKLDGIQVQNDQATQQARLKQKENAAKKAQLDAEEAQRIKDANNEAEKERRKLLVDRLNDELSRTKDATGKLLDLKTSEIDSIREKELELQSISYGKQKDDVIEKARAREFKLNEEAFLKLSISQAAYEANKVKLGDDANVKLLESEQALLDGYDSNNTKINNTIQTRFDNISNLTQSETAKINQERLALELSYEKQSKLLAAESIQDIETRNNAILLINQEYAAKEIKQLNATKDAELEILDEKYFQDINKLGITTEEKDKINAQYELDKVKLTKASQVEIDKIGAEDVKNSQANADEKRRIFIQSLQGIASETLNLFATVQATISAQNLSVIENAKSDALEAFDAEKEAYDNLQGDKTLAQKAAWIEEQKIKAERRALEEEYDKQSRAAQNEANIRQWEYQIAQAAVNAAGFILAAGAENALPGAAAAAIVAAIQVAAILANPPQKLATGGAVNGSGTGTSDSIPTMLSNGEYVIKADSVKKMGIPMLNMINATGKAPMINSGINKMATGGLVTNVNVDNSQMANMMAEFMNRPIKTYVTSTDVTQTQNSDNRLNTRTTF